jgi:geranylgeranyl pyrophosphate synthase
MTDDALDYSAGPTPSARPSAKTWRKLTDPAPDQITGPCSPQEPPGSGHAIRKESNRRRHRLSLDLIERYEGIPYALAQASRAVAAGKESLAVFPDTPPRQALMAIADYVIDRKR